MKTNHNNTFILSVLAALALLGNHAQAQSATWSTTAADGIWSNSLNWDPSGVPGVGDTATFDNAGNSFTTINTGTISLGSILFDTASAAAYTLGSGTVTFADGTTTAVTMNSTVAANQTINANITLGTAIVGNTSFINNSTTNKLTLGGNITGGTGGINAAKTVTFGGAGNIDFSGSLTKGGASSISLTKTNAGHGKLTLTGASTILNLTVSEGTVEMNSGASISASGRLLMNFRTGVLTLNTGSTLTTVGNGGGASNFVGVDSGNATLNVNGGTANFNGMALGEGYLRIGANNSSTGLVSVTSGTLNVGHSMNIGGRFNNDQATTANSTGTLTISGGNVNVGTGTATSTTNGNRGWLYLKNDAAGSAGSATLNLDGGTLSLIQLQSGSGGGTKTVNFNGGTLKALADNSTLLNGATGTTYNVKDNGAIIDSNSFDVGIGVNLVDGGTGLGGLTKSGAGTLTLSGTNTYGGATTISAGTLLLDATGSIASTTLGFGVTDAANGLLTANNAVFAFSGALDLDINGVTVNNQTWTLFDGTGFDATALSISGVTSDIGSLTFGDISGDWQGTDGTGRTWTFSPDLGTLTVIPEPSTLVLLVLSLTTAMVLGRRRNS